MWALRRLEDVVYCSAGYCVGCGAYRVARESCEWTSEELGQKEGTKLANYWSTPVVRDGRLYGMFQLKNWGSGPGKCVDIRTRKVLWPREGFAPGNGILARVRLLALSDEGELVIISGRFGNIQTTARADVLEGKCWSTMTLARDSIYARWTKEAACFETVK